MSDFHFWLNCRHCGVSYQARDGHIQRPTRCGVCDAPICDACDLRSRQADYDHGRNRMGNPPGASEQVNHTLMLAAKE